MKKLMFAICLSLGAAVVYAQDTTSTSRPADQTSVQPSQPTQEDGRVKIKSQDLPDVVKKSLESQDYRGWLVNSAYRVKSSSASGSATGATASENYIVELKNGAQTKTIRFDKDGKQLDSPAQNNRDQK